MLLYSSANTPVYPENLVVSSTGEAGQHRKHQMGVYKKLPDKEVRNNRPIYQLKKGNPDKGAFHFSYNDNGQWLIAKARTGNNGGIRTTRKELVTPLHAEYEYYMDGHWTEDNKLTVKSLGEIQ